MISRTVRMIGLALLAGALATSCSGLSDDDDTTRDEEGAIVEGGELDAFAINVGDCIAEEAGLQIESVEGIACTQPHAYEAYHAFDLPDGDYPPATEIDTAAQDGCLGAFAGYVGIEYIDSIYDITWFTPTAESWNQIDDREILCLILNLDGSPLTGSVQGSGT